MNDVFYFIVVIKKKKNLSVVSVQFIIAVYKADASVFLATFVEVTANKYV